MLFVHDTRTNCSETNLTRTMITYNNVQVDLFLD